MTTVINIGICDDESYIHKNIEDYCDKYRPENIRFEYRTFLDGRDVVDYCADERNETIDLLFLDIEMRTNGLEILDGIIKDSKIWRIAFVSSHTEAVLDMFSIKTIGFIPKPIEEARVDKIISSLIDEYCDNIEIEVTSGNHIELIKSEEIVYLKASGSYTEIYANRDNEIKKYTIVKKIGEMERLLDDRIFLRVHKSYLVNAEYIIYCKTSISIMKSNIVIPIGRIYKKTLDEKIKNYKSMRIRSRL